MADHLLTDCSADRATPLVSVVMPVYNGEQYLAEAIDSILGQTFTNFELIIIDDGSTDNSLDVLNKYPGLDARVRLIARENRNLATTLNDLIDLARGEWVARMDQDDVSLPHRLERQLQWLKHTGADICGSWVKFFGTTDRRILKHPQSDEAIKIELLFDSPFAHPSVIMRTALVRQLRYDKLWEKAEDYDLWERAARMGWRMSNVQEVLLLYRQHAAQITRHTFDLNFILSQKIRRRRWEYVAEEMCLEQEWIDEVMKLREPTTDRIEMSKVDAAFSHLLERVGREAQITIVNHVSRLFIKVAGVCPGVLSSWRSLKARIGTGVDIKTNVKLLLLSTFKIKSDSEAYERLRQWYFRINSKIRR